MDSPFLLSLELSLLCGWLRNDTQAKVFPAHKMASVLAQSVSGARMSMIMCTRCDRMIDSDDNPECFVHDREGNLTDEVWCESCWCDALDKREEGE